MYRKNKKKKGNENPLAARKGNIYRDMQLMKEQLINQVSWNYY